jgi:hypothetical protein
MSYETCLEKVKTELVKFTETHIKENQGAFFDMWVEVDCGHAFGHKYTATFKEVFGENVTNEDIDVIFTTGNQVGFLLTALVKSNVSEAKIIKIAKIFVSAQIEDFGNWCCDVCMRMYEDEEDENINDPV